MSAAPLESKNKPVDQERIAQEKIKKGDEKRLGGLHVSRERER